MKPIGLLAIAIVCTPLVSAWAQDEGVLTAFTQANNRSGASNAYPEGDFQEQLAAATGASPDSNPHPWGAGGSPFRTGPGLCDDYRVGRRWRVAYDGLVLFRDTTDLEALAATAVAGGNNLIFDDGTLASNFNAGTGGKLLLTSHWPQCRGYEMQFAYEGIFEWNAGLFDPEVAPAGPIGIDAPITQRALTYRSSLHSIEANVAHTENRVFQPFGGIRYIRFAENLTDLADQAAPTPFPPVVDLTITDLARNVNVNNNLIGFHTGARSELNPDGTRFTFGWYGSAGAYANLIQRSSALRQTDTFLTPPDPAIVDDPGSIIEDTTVSGFKSDGERIAFVGEISLAAAYQVNRCTKVRLGYQALVLSGIELGDALFVGAGGLDDSLFFQGWFAGIERRR